MALALFDLDNTLLAGDSDYLWGCFLVEKGLVDSNTYESTNKQFYEDYARGELDIYAFLAFSLKPLSKMDSSELATLHKQFMQEKIIPIMTSTGQEKINQHKQAGDHVVIITATNDFVTEPIAEAFGVHDLIASQAEKTDGQYTGKVTGTPCYQQGKVTRLNAWLEKNNMNLQGSTFYSDSHNDLPLLKCVDQPIAVDPDDTLKKFAEDHSWEICSFR